MTFLARFIGALATFGPADHVVRLTADCPLADPEAIDAVIDKVTRAGADYGSNTPPQRTFPKGLDVEAMTAAALREAAARAATAEEREHVTWALHRRQDLYRQVFVSQAAAEGDVRWTVDYPDDYAFIRAVYDGLYPSRPRFQLRRCAPLRSRAARSGPPRRRAARLAGSQAQQSSVSFAVFASPSRRTGWRRAWT